MIKDPRKVKIGHWYYFSGRGETGEIRDKKELLWVRENMDAQRVFFFRVFSTKKKASRFAGDDARRASLLSQKR